MFDQTPYQTPHAKNYGPQINPRNFLSARFQYGGTLYFALWDSNVQIKEEYSGYMTERDTSQVGIQMFKLKKSIAAIILKY